LITKNTDNFKTNNFTASNIYSIGDSKNDKLKYDSNHPESRCNKGYHFEKCLIEQSCNIGDTIVWMNKKGDLHFVANIEL
jgi:hypothetical protein